jgi:hypothetical protein
MPSPVLASLPRRLLVLKDVECSVMPPCAQRRQDFASHTMHVSFMRCRLETLVATQLVAFRTSSVAPIACVSHHASPPIAFRFSRKHPERLLGSLAAFPLVGKLFHRPRIGRTLLTPSAETPRPLPQRCRCRVEAARRDSPERHSYLLVVRSHCYRDDAHRQARVFLDLRLTADRPRGARAV